MSTQSNKKTLKQRAAEFLTIAFTPDPEEVKRLNREVGGGARQQALLNEIDRGLMHLLDNGMTTGDIREKSTLSDDDGESLFDQETFDETLANAIKDGYFITRDFEQLMRVTATLSLLLREKWTYS